MSNSATFTCPMHPEVASDQPGSCPKCGMKLVPQDNIDHMAQHQPQQELSMQDHYFFLSADVMLT